MPGPAILMALLRRWLYTIATNTSLDLLKKGSPRTLPTAASSAWDPMRPVAPRSAEVLWLDPFPDSWLAEATENPEARYMRSESVSLAFLTALRSKRTINARSLRACSSVTRMPLLMPCSPAIYKHGKPMMWMDSWHC
jgi:hypothetical protein